MCSSKAGRLLSILILGLGMTGCGAGKIAAVPVSPVVPPTVQTPPTTLTGNWLLAGSRVPAAYPVVSATIFVQGNTVTGEAAFAAQCTSNGFGVGYSSSSLAINGTIANDGTFQASTQTGAALLPGSISLSLTGNSPLAATPTVWTGTYSLTATPPSGGVPCSLTQAVTTFTATPIASVTGTYIGTPVNSGTPFGAAAVVSVQIVQGAPVLVTRGSTSSYRLPLTATLTITNSACPFSGSTTAAEGPSYLVGDSFTLILTPDFPFGFLSGTLNDPTGDTFSGELTSLANATGCMGIAAYNFTRK